MKFVIGQKCCSSVIGMINSVETNSDGRDCLQTSANDNLARHTNQHLKRRVLVRRLSKKFNGKDNVQGFHILVSFCNYLTELDTLDKVKESAHLVAHLFRDMTGSSLCDLTVCNNMENGVIRPCHHGRAFLINGAKFMIRSCELMVFSILRLEHFLESTWNKIGLMEVFEAIGNIIDHSRWLSIA